MQVETCYFWFPELLLRWSDVFHSVPQASDLLVPKGLRSRDSPLLSLWSFLPLLWWNWAQCTSLDHSKAIKCPLSAVASVVFWCQLLLLYFSFPLWALYSVHVQLVSVNQFNTPSKPNFFQILCWYQTDTNIKHVFFFVVKFMAIKECLFFLNYYYFVYMSWMQTQKPHDQNIKIWRPC